MPIQNDQHTHTPCAHCGSTAHGAALFWFPDRPPPPPAPKYRLICCACRSAGVGFTGDGQAMQLLEPVKKRKKDSPPEL